MIKDRAAPMPRRRTLETLQGSTQLRIGMTGFSHLGGSGIVAAELALALVEAGHIVHFVSKSLPPRTDSCSHGLVCHTLDDLNHPGASDRYGFLPLALKLAEIAERESIDLLHAHYAVPHAVAALLARDMLGSQPLGIVTTLHGTDVTTLGYDPRVKRLVRYCCERSDAVTCVSSYLATQVSRIAPGIAPVVIPNFPPLTLDDGLSANLKSEFGVPADRPVVTHISSFRPMKRSHDIPKILELVNRQLPVTALIVGDGPERPGVEQSCCERGLAGSVLFLGERKDIGSILGASDILLVTSESEGFGLVVLEAIASGVVCVTTNAGGLTEVVHHGVTGLVVEVGNVQDFADAIIRLLNDQALASTLRSAASGMAAEKFNRSTATSRYLGVYRDILRRQISVSAID